MEANNTKYHRVYLIRHSMTKGNIEKRYIGCRTDEPLCDEGFEMLRSADIGSIPRVDRIFSSSMNRCMTTAEHLFPGGNIEKINSLTEMDFGLYEGKNYEDLKDEPYYQRWIDSGGTLPFPEGEDMAGFSARSMSEFAKIIAMLNDGESAAIVCHGGNIMGILSKVTGGDYFDFNVRNLEGFNLEIECDGELLNVLSYERFGVGMRA